MGRKQWTYAAGGAAILALCAGWVLGLAFPHQLSGTLGWTAVVVGVLFGGGAALRRLFAVAIDTGEQLLLGTAAWIFVTGVLMTVGVASRVPLLVVAAVATLAAIYELVDRTRRAASSTRPLWSGGVPPYVVLGAVVGVLLLINVLAAVGSRGNPYDDNISYTGFVKRLLDCGNLTEPFSFRRLSAYGGQTSLLALAGLRGDVQTTELLDRGIFQGITVLVMLGMAHRRKVHVGVAALLTAFLLLEWDLTFNSACLWTGVAMFLGAYGFASREDLAPEKSLLLTFVACGAACTLRQNFIAPAGLFAGLLLLSHLRAQAAGTSWREAWVAQRRTVLICIAVAAAIIVPFAISAWISNHTFLYPVVPGTANQAAPLRPNGSTPLDEVAFFFTVIFNPDPFRIWWVLVPFMLLARDLRARKPWPLFLIACTVGWAMLVHSFLLSNVWTLWRYAIGFITPLMIVFLLDVADQLPFADKPERSRLRLPSVAAFLIWMAVIIQLSWSRGAPAAQAKQAMEDIKAALVLGSDKAGPLADTYRDMQAALPEGAKLAVLLDDTYLLDYARNQVFNLDLPGFSAPAPGMPSFLGAERWRTYFTSLGIRYVAFVDGKRSNYLYRRDGWLPRLFNDDNDMWRFMAVHMLDIEDSFAALAKTSQVVFQRDGIWAIDLGAPRVPDTSFADPPEWYRMDRYSRWVSETELGNNAWQLASRSHVAFQNDGYGPTVVQLGGVPTAGPPPVEDRVGGLWDLVFGARPHEPPFRYLMDRTHVRLRGEVHQHLHIKLWVNTVRLFTHPTLRASLDGKLLGEATPDADGYITFDADTTCTDWCDLYIRASTISEFWAAPDWVRAIKLLELDWTETGA